MLKQFPVRRFAMGLVSAPVFLFVQGCNSSYLTPGGPASIAQITSDEVAEAVAREPAAEFPARLVVARVQAPGYTSYTNRGYGTGRFSVLTARDIETSEHLDRIARLPGVAAVGSLNRLLLPAQLETATELRAAAAELRGDILMMYTLDTVFRTDTTRLGPLSAIGLGFFPNKNAVVTSTCAVAFIDVRTGFIYGATEATASEEQRSNYWNTRNAIDSSRLVAERTAFSDAIDGAAMLWQEIVARHAE